MAGLLPGLSAGLLLLYAFPARADPEKGPWFVRVWRVEDGLPNPNVTGVVQAPDGHLWVLTRTTLSRFDGMHFEELSSTNFVPQAARSFRALLGRRDGGLWVAMEPGVVAGIDPKGARLFTLSSRSPHLVPQTVVEDGDGRLWMTCRGGGLYQSKDGEMVPVTDPGLPNGSMVSVTLDNDNRLWWAKGGRVGLWHEGKFQPKVRVPGNATRLAAARSGGLWICSGFRLFKYDQGGQLRYLGAFGPEPPQGEPTALFEDSNGAVWIGTLRTGLFRYDGVHFENVPTSDREIVSLMEDRERNLWVTTTSGLNCIQPRAISLESTGTGGLFDSVQSVCEDPNGGLWGATENGLLVRRMESGWKVVLTNRATCVTADRSGAIWIGTSARELHCLKDGALTVLRRSDGLAGHTVLGLLAGRTGDLWIGQEAPTALQCFRSGKFVSVALPASTQRIRAMAEDLEGNVWIGTEDGKLFRVRDDVATDETPRIFPVSKAIRALHCAADGTLFIGTSSAGLGWLKDGRFFQLNSSQGLHDPHTSQLVSDEHGWLWIGSDRGILKLRQEELEQLAQGRIARVQSIHYGGLQGLPALQGRFGVCPGALRSRDGRLWIPMRTGLAVVVPEKLRLNIGPPRVHLKQVVLDDRVIAVYSGTVMSAQNLADLGRPNVSLRLPPGHRRIDFRFTGLSFVSPEKVHFRYRLEGFDAGWVEARTERSASYSRLPAGDYRFRVNACNADGVWSEAGAAVAFSVAPFVWQTFGFRFGALAALGGLCLGVTRFVSLRRLRRKLRSLEKQSALDKERARIARDIHDDVGSRLTEIVLLSELELHEGADRAAAASRVPQISTAARQVLKLLDETVWAITPRNDTLPHTISYIGQFAAKFLKTANIRCRTDFPDNPPCRTLSTEARHNLFLTVKEALNNIVQHSSATEVSLRLLTVGDALRIDIEDNGRGFVEATGDGCADGLRNMRQRMNEIGGGFHIESAAGAGTRISLVLPWSGKD